MSAIGTLDDYRFADALTVILKKSQTNFCPNAPLSAVWCNASIHPHPVNLNLLTAAQFFGCPRALQLVLGCEPQGIAPTRCIQGMRGI